jgi:arginase family enzyme
MLTVAAVAPATGTPETGGWSTRELREIIRGLKGLNIIAADVVEVAVCVLALSFLWLPC